MSERSSDLERVLGQIQLDLLAADASRVLTREAVDHAVLKGPTTARWLYAEPRRYSDVDLLIPASQLPRAERALTAAGVAKTRSGLGQESPHSLVMQAASGLELDLHITLPGLAYRHTDNLDAVWQALVPHIVPFDITNEWVVPALDDVGRCVVLALHAIEGGFDREQPREDLRRARKTASEQTWAQAGELAAALGAKDLFDNADAVLDPSREATSEWVRLKRSGGGPTALALQRLLDLSWRGKIIMLRRELLPRKELLLIGQEPSHGASYVRLYVRRFAALGRQLPAAIRQLRRARSR